MPPANIQCDSGDNFIITKTRLFSPPPPPPPKKKETKNKCNYIIQPQRAPCSAERQSNGAKFGPWHGARDGDGEGSGAMSDRFIKRKEGVV